MIRSFENESSPYQFHLLDAKIREFSKGEAIKRRGFLREGFRACFRHLVMVRVRASKFDPVVNGPL